MFQNCISDRGLPDLSRIWNPYGGRDRHNSKLYSANTSTARACCTTNLWKQLVYSIRVFLQSHVCRSYICMTQLPRLGRTPGAQIDHLRINDWRRRNTGRSFLRDPKRTVHILHRLPPEEDTCTHEYSNISSRDKSMLRSDRRYLPVKKMNHFPVISSPIRVNWRFHLPPYRVQWWIHCHV